MSTFFSNAARQLPPSQFADPQPSAEPFSLDSISQKLNSTRHEPVWGCEEAAVFLRIHPKTVKRLASMGNLPGFRIGNRWRFRPSELDAWAHSGIPSNHSLRRE
jgi:excisionase family DNA binding protein